MLKQTDKKYHVKIKNKKIPEKIKILIIIETKL
jgi:hypothetical protein